MADKLVRWAVEKIDSRGLEACLEATVFSRPVLVKHGFVPVRNAKLNLANEAGSEQWNRMAKDLERVSICIMWRPRGGVFREGETVIPGKERSKAKL